MGITAGEIMVWAVLASTANIPSGALAGVFIGASGDASLGLGAGAISYWGNAQVRFTPAAIVGGQVGINLALGVLARMTLTPSPVI